MYFMTYIREANFILKLLGNVSYFITLLYINYDYLINPL